MIERGDADGKRVGCFIVFMDRRMGYRMAALARLLSTFTTWPLVWCPLLDSSSHPTSVTGDSFLYPSESSESSNSLCMNDTRLEV